MGNRRHVGAKSVAVCLWRDPDWSEGIGNRVGEGREEHLRSDWGTIVEKEFCDVVPALRRHENHEDAEWVPVEVNRGAAAAAGEAAGAIEGAVSTSLLDEDPKGFGRAIDFEEEVEGTGIGGGQAEVPIRADGLGVLAGDAGGDGELEGVGAEG